MCVIPCNRFELVKSIRRSRDKHNKLLTLPVLERCCKKYERAENLMQYDRFAEAEKILIELVNELPSFTLAYYKLGMARVAQGHNRMKDASPAFRVAYSLEPKNISLSGGMDLVIRLVSGVDVPKKYWGAQYAKSNGDVSALLSLCVGLPRFQENAEKSQSNVNSKTTMAAKTNSK